MNARILKAYVRARTDVAKWEAKATESRKKMNEAYLRLAEAMEKEGIQTFKAGDVGVSYQGVKTHYRMPKAVEEIGFKWLREIGADGLIKSREAVHWGSLESFCSELVEKGGQIPSFIEQYNEPQLDFSGIKNAVSKEKNNSFPS